MWGIWIAMNAFIFKYESIPIFQTFAQVCALFQLNKPSQYFSLERPMGEAVVDKSYAWGCFHGTYQVLESLCNLGGVLYLFNSHYFQIK